MSTFKINRVGHVILIVVSLLLLLPAITFASSVEFDGIDDYLVAADSPDLSIAGDFTIEYWVNFDEFSSSLGTLVAKYGGPNNFQRAYYTSYYLKDGVGTFESRISNDGLNTTVVPLEYQLDLESWYHIVFVYDSSEGEVDLYLAEAGSNEHVLLGTMGGHLNSIKDTVSRFMLGTSDGDDPLVFFDGKMDEVRVWSDVRSKEELDMNFRQELLGDEKNLVAYWNFNESLADSANGQDLTNFNGVTFSEDSPLNEEPQNAFTLYTQIESAYPSLEETMSWAGDTYAGGGDYWCGTTIAGCGCAITSIAMAARNAGLTEGVDGSDVNPGNFNAWLNNNEGYTSKGSIIWTRAADYFGSLLAEGISTPLKLETHRANTAEIDNALRSEESLVIGYSGNKYHYFVVSDLLEDGYEVRDPFWFNTQTTNDTRDVAGSIQDYNDDIAYATVYDLVSAEVQSGILSIYADSPVELQLTNEEGDQTGKFEDQLVENISKSSYVYDAIIGNQFQDKPLPEHLPKSLIVGTAAGEYQLQVVGTHEDIYTLTFEVRTPEGGRELHEFVSSTTLDQVDTFLINIETGEVVEEKNEEDDEITREKFMALVEVAAEDERKRTKRFLLRFADRVFDAYEADRDRLALIRLRVFTKLLYYKHIDDAELDAAIKKLEQQIRTDS